MHSGVIWFSLACARLPISVAGFAVRVAPTPGAGLSTSSTSQDLMPMLLPHPSASRRRLHLRTGGLEGYACGGGRWDAEARCAMVPVDVFVDAMPAMGGCDAITLENSCRLPCQGGRCHGLETLTPTVQRYHGRWRRGDLPPEAGATDPLPVAPQQSAPVSAVTPHVRSACKWGADNVRCAAANRSGRKGVTLLPPAFAPQLNSSKEIA